MHNIIPISPFELYQVKIDWDRYVDEDEEEGGFDTSALDGGMGMGGMEVSSSFFIQSFFAVCLLLMYSMFVTGHDGRYGWYGGKSFY